MYGELISRPVPATKTGQAPSRQYRATPSVVNILAVYLVFSSGVADPSLTSEGSAMPLPSLGSAVGSGDTCGSPWNRKGMVLRSVLSTNTKQASPHRAGASYFRLLRPLRALSVKKLGRSGGSPRKNFKIRHSEIASEALFGSKKLLEFPHL